MGCTGTAGGGIFMARTACDSSSEYSADFLEKLILICEEELREASEVAELDSGPLRLSTRSMSNSLLTSGERVAFANEFCTVVEKNDAPSFSMLFLVTSVFTEAAELQKSPFHNTIYICTYMYDEGN